MKTRWLLCCVLATGVAHADAFRNGEPEVVAPPPATLRTSLDDTPWAALQSALARRGNPRFALLWNVAWSDEVEDAHRRVLSDDEQRVGDRFEREETAGGDTSTRFLEGGEREKRHHVQSEETRRIDSDTRDAATREADWAMEPAFTRELELGGLRFVDARMATRKGALDGMTGDRQEAQMRGLERYADFLVEVTIQRAPGTTLGRTFRVAVSSTADGGKVVDFLSEGEVRFQGHRPYVATDSGFARAPAPRATPEMAVRQLAADTARELLAALH